MLHRGHNSREVKIMLNNSEKDREMAVGFLMELARHPDQLDRFASLSREEQLRLSDGAKSMHTKEAMRNYVESI